MPEIQNRTDHKTQKRRTLLARMVDTCGDQAISIDALNNHLTVPELNSWLNGLGVPSEVCKSFSKHWLAAMIADEEHLLHQLAGKGFDVATVEGRKALALMVREHRRDIGFYLGAGFLKARLNSARSVKLMKFLTDGSIVIGATTGDSTDGPQWNLEDCDFDQPNPPGGKPNAAGELPGDVPVPNPDDEDKEPMTPNPNVGNPADGLTTLLAQAMLPMIRDEIRRDEGKLTEARVTQMIETAIKTRVPHVIQLPAPVPGGGLPPLEIAHMAYPQVLKSTACGLNIMLIGPAGSGKTTVAEQVARALNVEFRFTGAVDSPYKLTGFTDASGRTVRTAFRESYEHGGLFLFDEVDASSPGALMAFNAALANGYADFPDGMVKRHDKFYCIAAANTFGRGADRIYVGRNQLDGATLDRFVVVDFDYDEAMESQLAGNDMREWVSHVQKIRKAVFKLKLRFVVSPRASIFGARLLRAGMSRALVEEMVLWKGMEQESRAKVKAEAKI